MRAIRVAPLALSGAAALLLAAPVAHASPDGGPGTFTPTVTPSVAAPGGQVTLGSGGCGGATTITSGIFDTAVIPAGTTTATAKVDWDAKRGAIYAVTFKCGSSGEAKNVGLTISGGTSAAPVVTPTTAATGTATASSTVNSTAAAGTGTGATPGPGTTSTGTTATATATASSGATPGGVQGGLGGSAGSTDPGEIATGAALVAAAAAGTALYVRRRRGRHQH
ncbi:hypothetical protein [uncultured Streptomyces sp.]|uniref:hypothetical protein n=1 Tax=uncultured Streptomyces sp. TaxID=174707 RepID=UPI00260F2D1C|nr:hypothetical protein [uncultured Streptomyces sp.]